MKPIGCTAHSTPNIPDLPINSKTGIPVFTVITSIPTPDIIMVGVGFKLVFVFVAVIFEHNNSLLSETQKYDYSPGISVIQVTT